MTSKLFSAVASWLLAVALATVSAQAQQAASISVSVKNHQFQPAQLYAPANVPITLRVKNLDSTPMEFESVSLRVEKVVTGNSESVTWPKTRSSLVDFACRPAAPNL
jgi:archaellum component FlaG (FlaF/FlaG flagellin family)